MYICTYIFLYMYIYVYIYIWERPINCPVFSESFRFVSTEGEIGSAGPVNIEKLRNTLSAMNSVRDCNSGRLWSGFVRPLVVVRRPSLFVIL